MQHTARTRERKTRCGKWGMQCLACTERRAVATRNNYSAAVFQSGTHKEIVRGLLFALQAFPDGLIKNLHHVGTVSRRHVVEVEITLGSEVKALRGSFSIDCHQHKHENNHKHRNPNTAVRSRRPGTAGNAWNARSILFATTMQGMFLRCSCSSLNLRRRRQRRQQQHPHSTFSD